MYSEDDYIMISALQHYLFCPRQCALIHLDQYWCENLLTASGRVMHERVDTPGTRIAGLNMPFRFAVAASESTGLPIWWSTIKREMESLNRPL